MRAVLRRLELGRIHLVGVEIADQIEDKGVAPREIVQTEILAHLGAGDVTAPRAHIPHVAVLAGRYDAVQFVAGELGRVDAGRGILAPRPFAVGPLDREHPPDLHRRMFLVEGVRRVVAVRDLREDGAAHVVADAAEVARTVVWRLDELVVRLGVRVGTPPERGRVVYELSVAVMKRVGVDSGEHIGVDRGAHALDVVLVDHAVAEIAVDAVPVFRVQQIAVRVDRPSLLPSSG